MKLTVDKCDGGLECYNRVHLQTHSKYVSIRGMIFTVAKSNVENKILLNSEQRKSLDVILDSEIEITEILNLEPVQEVTFRADLFTNKHESSLSQSDVQEIKRNLIGVCVSNRCKVIIRDEKRTPISLLSSIDGLIGENTVIKIFSQNKKLQVVDPDFEDMTSKKLFKSNFNFKEMGIGGLQNEFDIIFRRAFASRTLSKSDVEKLGIQHIMGILLYGPPGTGKTMIASKMCQILNCEEPDIVTGPSILGRYVGESEENIRKLFEKAEKDPDNLHAVIIDEFDSIGLKRGSRSDSTGVMDSVVNQLLAKMCGPKSLPNIIVIAMTNRIEILDEALLRPGRFELHVEIKIPDEEGRNEILEIHTSKLLKGGFLNSDVNLREISQKTPNFSGAELNGLVTSARTYGIARLQDPANNKYDIDIKKLKLHQSDFLKAVKDIKPILGSFSDELNIYLEKPFEFYCDSYKNIYNNILELTNGCSFGRNKSIELNGESYSGKTMMIAHMTKQLNNYGCVRYVNAEQLKHDNIYNLYIKCCSAESTIFIIDDLEAIISYVDLNRQYSSQVFNDVRLILNHKLPKHKRSVVIITCSNPNLTELLDVKKKINHSFMIPEEYNESGLTYSEYFKGL